MAASRGWYLPEIPRFPCTAEVEATKTNATEKGGRPFVCRSPADWELVAACCGPWRAPWGAHSRRLGRGHRGRCSRRRREPVVEAVLVAPLPCEVRGHLSDVIRGEGP